MFRLKNHASTNRVLKFLPQTDWRLSDPDKLMIEHITARPAYTHRFADRCLLVTGKHADCLYGHCVEKTISKRQRLYVALFQRD
jgi:hypothetical protein